ncbi:hypothetical protein DFQ27_000188 [Actinomortierella ambigua]|uniref:Uncharacterized protein n=1 Tax=Actinomortierella ambigua TaxID=1343610 RepID=A0A9P6QGZ6_9FUNG|nr:hypothetical protein DFQ27_000188 [Actinomortierella ambigua]
MARLSSSNGVVPPHTITSDEDSDDSYYVPSTPFSRRLAQVDPSLYQGNGDDFCTTENLVEAGAFVNHQLSIYGFPSNLQFSGTDEKQAVAIVTAFYKVLQQHQHESRKKEQEINGLRDKVQKAMNDRFSKSSVGVTLLNPPPRKRQFQYLPSQSKSLSVHGNSSPKTENELLLEEVLSQQRDKEVEVVAENEQLRRTLCTVHVELRNFLQKYGTSKDKDTSPNVFGLPFDMVKDRVEAEIRDQLTALGDQWTHRPAPEPTISPTEIVVRDQRIQDLQKEIEKLQIELANSTKLIQGAQTMIDNMANSQLLNGIQQFKLQLEESEMTAPEFDEAHAEIQKQREQLAKEREDFTQACLDLGRQREQLSKDQSDFEASKQTFQLEKFLAYLNDDGSATKDTPGKVQDLSFSSRPTPHQFQRPFSEHLVHPAPPCTFQQPGSSSTKRPTSTPANDFQPPSKKPMFTRPSQHVGVGQSYESRIEEVDESAGEQEGVHDDTSEGGFDNREEEFMLRTPTRSLGRMDRSLGLRDVVKGNKITTAGPGDTAAVTTQKPALRRTTVSGDGSAGTTSDQSDQLFLTEDLRATSIAPSSQSRDPGLVSTSTAAKSTTIFGRRPPSTPFSFRSAMALGGRLQDQQQQQQSSMAAASQNNPMVPSVDARPTEKATATAFAKQSISQTVSSDTSDRHLSLKSSARPTDVMSRAASSMAARKQSNVSNEQQAHTAPAPVDPFLVFTSPFVSLSNRTLARGEHQAPLTPLSTPSTSATQPSSAAVFPGTTATASASHSQGGLPAAQRRQQIYESNLQAFKAARTPQ